MKVKKRKKSSRYRGTHTHGRGFKKKARGSGHRGGVGMAGTGKRADQKKTLVLNLYGNDYFGRDKAIRKKPAIRLETINLGDIQERYKGQKEVVLKKYKILGKGELKDQFKITAKAASKSAIEKIKKSGGELIIENDRHKNN